MNDGLAAFNLLTEVVEMEVSNSDNERDSSPSGESSTPTTVTAAEAVNPPSASLATALPSSTTSTRSPPLTLRKQHPRASSTPPQQQNSKRFEAPFGATHCTKTLFSSELSVVTFNSLEFLVGVQVARRLKRKTFNMYRCMKKKKIALRRATHAEVEYLISIGAVHSGTHSVTLVPFCEGLCFIADALFRHIKFPNEGASSRRRKSYVNMRPRIHRRKPLPWDIQRSVKKSLAHEKSLSGALNAKAVGTVNPTPVRAGADPSPSCTVISIASPPPPSTSPEPASSSKNWSTTTSFIPPVSFTNQTFPPSFSAGATASSTTPQQYQFPTLV